MSLWYRAIKEITHKRSARIAKDESANFRWMTIDTTPSKIISAAANQYPTRLPCNWNAVTVDLVTGPAGIEIEQNAVSGASVITTFRCGPSAEILVILPIFIED
jgi:hypothetical protein